MFVMAPVARAASQAVESAVVGRIKPSRKTFIDGGTLPGAILVLSESIRPAW